jgi:hypothetical protein
MWIEIMRKGITKRHGEEEEEEEDKVTTRKL